MHRGMLLFVGLPLAAGLGIAATHRGAPPVKTERVNVNANCVNGEVNEQINPWQRRIKQDDDVEWRINENGRVDSIRVYPKDGWPFKANQPKGRRGGNDATAGDMEPDQAGKTYQYNVEIWCVDNRGDSLHAVIDPDIIIEETASF